MRGAKPYTIRIAVPCFKGQLLFIVGGNKREAFNDDAASRTT
jgi:hypothetical protein